MAAESSDLNLKLMKWRQFPSLDLDSIQSSKCLLLGAGTLGCQVGRNLIGWGVRDITFVDNGKVSFSNPVRQSLFTFEDCKNGGKYKANAAKDRLIEIFPKVNAKSYVLSIPMPGHSTTNADMKNIEKDYNTLVALIQECDVMFLLLDSREARWLPTMLGVAFNKIVLNAALGFDSYVVMRHGNIPQNELEMIRQESRKDETKETTINEAKTDAIDANDKNNDNGNEGFLLPHAPKKRLGCYYCQDVVAPRNVCFFNIYMFDLHSPFFVIFFNKFLPKIKSIADRTLDQQCTVTRPGLSGIAGSIITELMVCIVQHPLKQFAQITQDKQDENAMDMHNLGRSFSVIPHQIRGSLHNYSCNNYNVLSFEQCPGCSTTIINEYFKRGFEFVTRVINEPKYLEDVCGLTRLQSALDACDFGFDDDDEDDLLEMDLLQENDEMEQIENNNDKDKEKNEKKRVETVKTSSAPNATDGDEEFVAV